MDGSRPKQRRRKAKRLSKLAAIAERVPNMNMVAFEAATGAAFNRKLTPLYTTMPSDDELRSPDAILLLDDIVEFLKGIPRWHRRNWQKMINKSFPELGSVRLDLALQKLVVRCICTGRVPWGCNLKRFLNNQQHHTVVY